MKKLFLGMGLLVMSGFLWVSLTSEQAVAAAGCCKQKVGDNWRVIGKDYQHCVELNRNDDDNVFEPTGEYWWDSSC